MLVGFFILITMMITMIIIIGYGVLKQKLYQLVVIRALIMAHRQGFSQKGVQLSYERPVLDEGI